jgi:hypothetical protein
MTLPGVEKIFLSSIPWRNREEKRKTKEFV